jgi:hypothetical protein
VADVLPGAFAVQIGRGQLRLPILVFPPDYSFRMLAHENVIPLRNAQPIEY